MLNFHLFESSTNTLNGSSSLSISSLSNNNKLLMTYSRASVSACFSCFALLFDPSLLYSDLRYMSATPSSLLMYSFEFWLRTLG